MTGISDVDTELFRLNARYTWCGPTMTSGGPGAHRARTLAVLTGHDTLEPRTDDPTLTTSPQTILVGRGPQN